MSEQSKKNLSVINQKLSANIELAEGRVGEVISKEDYQGDLMADFQQEMRMASVSPFLSQAISEVYSNAVANFRAPNSEVVGVASDEQGHNVAEEIPVRPQTTETPNLPKIVTQAVMAHGNSEANELAVNPQWLQLSQVSNLPTHIGSRVFGVFPCFEDNVRKSGDRAAMAGVNCMVSMALREENNPSHNERNVVNGLGQRNLMASKHEMDAMAHWI